MSSIQQTTSSDSKTNTVKKFLQSSTKIEKVKPKLRGWIHLFTVPLSLAASIVLVCLASDGGTRAASAVYLVSTLLLFGVSAVYHRGTWSQTADGVLRRLDHSNIFLLIAGTYTPIGVALLHQPQERILLSIVWVGAVAGIAMRIFWLGAPRWLYTLLYVALGWVAVVFMKPLWVAGGPAIVWLLVAGGLSYTIGAVVYGAKRPDPCPKWFGFHEIFHSFTVVGWVCHCVAAYLAVLG